MTIFKTIFKTLNKNANSFTITDEAISNNSIFEVYPSDESVILADVTVNGTTANITFDSAAEYNIPCAVFINNLVGEYSPEFDHIDANNVYYNSLIHGERTIGNVFADLEFEFDSFVLPLSRQINEEVYTNTVPGGVFYHNANGNNIWKKLDASNIDYDSDSTIYSAMGNVDELETESNNLVDAINEVNSKPTSGMIFSSTPIVVGKFDNKDLYCKYITGNIIGGDFNVPHNIENLDLIIDYDVYRYTTDSNKWLWKAYGRGTNRSYSITVNGVNATNFDITVNGWNTGSLRIVVYYTINE